MELIFKNKRMNFIQQPTADLIINKINEWLEESYYFSYLKIDGVDVYEELEKYFMENLGSKIQKVEVIAKTVSEMINDTLLTADEYLNRAITDMKTLTEGFYNNPTSENWYSFHDILGGVEWIRQLISSINRIKVKPMNWEKYLKLSVVMDNELKKMLEAVENSDSILIADIILYELIPIFIELQKEIRVTIDTEGVRTDVN